MTASVEFYKSITDGNFEKTKCYLAADRALVNSKNEQGMPPLHEACFRGNLELVSYLLNYGADVNATDSTQGYTALMFAAISGNLHLTELLLQHGARSSYTNKVGRTAMQLAAFVGNQRISTFINNFIEKAELDFYVGDTVNSKLRLPSKISQALYRLILSLNITPVKIFLFIDPGLNSQTDAGSILDHWETCLNVCNDLREKYFTPHQTHEALSLKFHLIGHCIRKAGEYVQFHRDENSNPTPSSVTDKTKPQLVGLIKEFLRGADPHGLPLGQENFLRHVLTSFPHRESTLWQHLIKQVSGVQPGSSPTALNFIENAINGQGIGLMPMGDVSTSICSTCGDLGDAKSIQIKQCCNCKETGYCSVFCQRLHWFTHKKYCSILKAHHLACEKSQKLASLASI